MAADPLDDWGLEAELQSMKLSSVLKKFYSRPSSLPISEPKENFNHSRVPSSPPTIRKATFNYLRLPSLPTIEPNETFNYLRAPSSPTSEPKETFNHLRVPSSPTNEPKETFNHPRVPSSPTSEPTENFNTNKSFGKAIKPKEMGPNEADDEPELSAAEKSLMKKIFRTQLCLTTNEVEITRQREGSSMRSVKSFEQLQLPAELLRGVYAMGFTAPSKIQETSLPTLLANPPVNMIAQAQNGTGKTAAFVLAALSRVNAQEHFPQVLILAPTYELALQIGEVAMKMAKFCEQIKFKYVVKGETFPRGQKFREHFLIGTPGKVFDWAKRHHFFDLKAIRVFVFDEADVMISTQGHQDQCIRIHRELSYNCQMLLFSATYTPEVMDFAEVIIHDPIIIRLRKEEESLNNVKQYYIICKSPEEKYSAISNIYGVVSIGQAFIFCRKKITASWLGNKLNEDGHSVAYLSSDLDASQRIEALRSFREGKEKVLITTNVCARGIDVEQVSVVINFDLPVKLDGQADCETYLHRIGRSGRFGKYGIAVNMVADERDMQVLNTIQEHFGKKIEFVNADDVDDLEEMDK